MTPKKLYVVDVHHTVYVLADDESEAEDVAVRHISYAALDDIRAIRSLASGDKKETT